MTSAYQSAQVVVFSSCQVVPWPGSRGTSTAYPLRGERLAPRRHRRRLAGEAVAEQHADRGGRR